ncbi:hypothetical protein FRC12_010041 [Ceratobasidium sp. 428]|nr:hypothetical protein FRC09_006398 [Ceratobasidium sp. 395]KAG8758347.1 hypothetical protein FRC12_010041 [Ceratobasidium sp. 428]
MPMIVTRRPKSTGARLQDGKKPAWGPFVDPHVFTFEPKLSDAIAMDMPEKIWEDNLDKTMSLKTVMSHLLYDGLTQPLLRFSDMVMNLQKHIMVYGVYDGNNHAVTRQYYGFLSIRFLVHLVCCTILEKTAKLDLKKYAELEMSWSDTSIGIADAALDEAARALTSPILWRQFLDRFHHPDFVGFNNDVPRVSVPLSIQALWDDRGSILIFYMRGELPGLALLLLVLSEIISAKPSNHERGTGPYSQLQDLAFRLYLVGSPREQQILERICMAIIKKSPAVNMNSNRFFSADDTSTMSRVYSNLVIALEQDNRRSGTLPIDLVFHLIMLIYDLTISNSSTTDKERLSTIRASFRLLWLLFESRAGRIPSNDHPKVRCCAAATFSYFRVSVEDSAKESRPELARTLADFEVIGLAGRISLLLTSEGTTYFNDEWNSSAQWIKEIGKFQKVFSPFALDYPDLFYESKLEWAKIVDHFEFTWIIKPAKMDLGMKDVSMQWFDIQLLDISMTWGEYEDGLALDEDEFDSCAYPRCYVDYDDPPEETPLFRYVCGGCNEAAYCGLVCQRA